MSYDKTVNQIAIVGTGTIGASWTAHYLARGFDVVATDPGPDAEAKLRKYVDDAWGLLEKNGLAAGASRDRLSFTTNQSDALAKADFVQESAPEREDFKIKLFAELDAATPEDSIIASSSSGIPMSTIQSKCKRPERCVIGHPFNPPHIVPLVEVVGGTKTSADAIKQAMAFYASIGKKPILLHKELRGHVANRLQAALYKEILYLIQFGALECRGCGRCRVLRAGPALGSDGAQPAVASRRRSGRDSALHGHTVYRADPLDAVAQVCLISPMSSRRQSSTESWRRPETAPSISSLKMRTKSCWGP